MEKAELGSRGNYMLGVRESKRRAKLIMTSLYFGREEPFTNPKYLPQWTSDYDSVCAWMEDNQGKGLLLAGGVGNGKTLFIKTIIPKLLYETYGKIMDYTTAVDLEPFNAKEGRRRRYFVSIDDVGTEDIKSDYGSLSFPFARVMDHVDQNGGLVIASTNYDPDDLRQKYGPRTYDRMLKHMTFVFFKGKSLRTNPLTWDDLDAETFARWDNAGKQWALRKKEEQSRGDDHEAVRKHEQWLQQWTREQAEKCGMSVEQWRESVGKDTEALQRLWLQDYARKTSACFEWWLAARDLKPDCTKAKPVVAGFALRALIDKGNIA